MTGYSTGSCVPSPPEFRGATGPSDAAFAIALPSRRTFGENPAVDAGVAGVVGAAIGGGLATVTAIGTSWFSLRLARVQAKAQREESDRQRRFESVKERREPRAKVYAEFVTACQTVVRGVGQNVVQANQTRDRVRITPLAEATAVAKMLAAVCVVGPAPVANAAEAFVDAMVQMQNVHYGPDGEGAPEVLRHTRNLDERLAEFLGTARAALEDYGQAPVVAP